LGRGIEAYYTNKQQQDEFHDAKVIGVGAKQNPFLKNAKACV